MYREYIEKIAGGPIDFGLRPGPSETLGSWIEKLASAYEQNERTLDQLAELYAPLVYKVAQGEQLTPEEAQQAQQIENATEQIGAEQAAIEQAAEEAGIMTLGAIVEETAAKVLAALEPYINTYGVDIIHAVADVIAQVGDDIILAAQLGDPESVDALLSGVVAALMSYTDMSPEEIGAILAEENPVPEEVQQIQSGSPTATEQAGSATF